MAGSRFRGVCLIDVCDAFGVNQRTAQRMMREFEDTFPWHTCSTDDDRRRWWKLNDPTLTKLQGIRSSELAALDMAVRRASRDGVDLDVRALASLRDRLLASMPSPHARRAEADASAILEATGFATRPGPKVRLAPEVLGAITAAIQAPFTLEMQYKGGRDWEARARSVEPYGMLLGIRPYLVAKDTAGDGCFRRFRLDRIQGARITGQSFERDSDFDLEQYSAQAFGSFHSDEEYGQVVWRFSPRAAVVARDFVFHPHQRMTELPDGALLVEFIASGWVEMIWYLLQWGCEVEILEPVELRERMEDFRKKGFDVLP